LFSPREPPSTTDLCAARVEPKPPLAGAWSGSRSRRCTACGCAHDVETTTEPTLTISSVSARAERCRREATQRWRVHPTVGVPAGEGLKMTPRARFLSSHWVAHRPAALLARSLQHELKRAREKKKWALGFGRRRRRRFCSARFRVWPLDEDGRLTTCGPIDAAQVGKQNPGPGPRRGQRTVHAVT
jgi:hypothetical protein